MRRNVKVNDEGEFWQPYWYSLLISANPRESSLLCLFETSFPPYFFNYTLPQDPKDFHRLLKRVILLSKVFTKSNKKKMK